MNDELKQLLNRFDLDDELYGSLYVELEAWHTRKLKEAVREARIDELERVYPQLQKHYGVSGEGNYYYDDRIAELKAQQEEV